MKVRNEKIDSLFNCKNSVCRNWPRKNESVLFNCSVGHSGVEVCSLDTIKCLRYLNLIFLLFTFIAMKSKRYSWHRWVLIDLIYLHRSSNGPWKNESGDIWTCSKWTIAHETPSKLTKRILLNMYRPIEKQ